MEATGTGDIARLNQAIVTTIGAIASPPAGFGVRQFGEAGERMTEGVRERVAEALRERVAEGARDRLEDVVRQRIREALREHLGQELRNAILENAGGTFEPERVAETLSNRLGEAVELPHVPVDGAALVVGQRLACQPRPTAGAE